MHFVFFILLFFSCPRLSPDRSQGFVWCGNPPQPYNWKSPPIVRVCSKDPEVRKRVDLALDFWRDLGHEFGTVVRGDNNGESCDRQASFSIVIKQVTSFPDERRRGQASTRTLGDMILGVEVDIMKGYMNDTLILEHEIGHALGYKHLACRSHIMHPSTNYIGSFTIGVENKHNTKKMSTSEIELVETIVCEEK